MAKHVMFLGWNRTFPGREMVAIELLSSTLGYLTKQQNAGRIESFEPVMLAPHSSNLNGFVLVRGDREKLDLLRRSDEWLDLTTRAALCIKDFGVIDGVIGEELQNRMALFQKLAPSMK